MNKTLVISLILLATVSVRSVSVARDFFAPHLERFAGPGGRVVTVVFWDAPIIHIVPSSFPTPHLPNPFPAAKVLDPNNSTRSLSSSLRAFSQPIRLTIDKQVYRFLVDE